MDQQINYEGSKNTLSVRKSEIALRKHSEDETINSSVVEPNLISAPITENPTDELNNGRKISKRVMIFEPLNEEGERYLQEHMTLPPIDLTTMPSKYYINLHPTESIMSSSANSTNEWWDKLDYSDEEVNELECARDGREVKLIRKYIAKPKEVIGNQPEKTERRIFPRTLEMQKERQYRELQEEEANRAEIITKLEKQMVSLYNLKKQYKKTLAGEACTRTRTSLPPLVVSDKLARQRDSLISRIKRKKLEDDVKRKKQIERKINIVRTLLNEQKQKEKGLKREIEQRVHLTHKKQKKTREGFRTGSLDATEDISHDLIKTESTEEVNLSKDDSNVLQDMIGSQFPSHEVPPPTDDHQEPHTPQLSPRKSIKGARKKKSSEASTKKDGKQNKKKKKKDTTETEEAPAICEPPQELPASQMAELSLWFENWRDGSGELNRWQKESEDKQLPIESGVTLKPSKLVFKNVVAGRRLQQVVVVTNMGRDALQCRVIGVRELEDTGNSTGFQAALSGPGKARTGQSWSLTVTLDPLEVVGDVMAEVVMLCCRGEFRTRLSVEVQVLTPRAEPTLSSSLIRFGPQMYWSSGPFTRHLHISNPGGLSCLVYWREVVDQITPLQAPSDSFSDESVERDEKNVEIDEENAKDQEQTTRIEAVQDILNDIFNNVFRVFRVDAWQPIPLQARSQLSLPVRFVPAKSEERGDVFTKYRFSFEGENVGREIQELLICGKIKCLPYKLGQEIINMKLCYTGGTVQQAKLVVYSSARHACHVAARVPRALASVVSVVPRSTMVGANSYVTLAVRLVLGWDFLDRPNRYLDTTCGLLMFPVAVWVTDTGAPGAPPLEATVIASVAPPCPLTLAPPVVELGTVTTMETVEAELRLRNHGQRSYDYAFVDLPASIMIEPSGGTGSILPFETVKLKILFSPRAKDVGVECERPGGEGEINIALRCFTTVSLASPIQRQGSKKEYLSKQESLNISGISSKYTVSMHTNQPSSKQPSQSESVQYLAEKDRKNIASKIVSFQESIAKSVSEESFVNIPLNDEVDEEEVDGETFNGEEVNAEDYLNISEVKEEDNQLDTEDLWDFYSTFRFGKCSRDERNEEELEKYIALEQENGADLSENRSILGKDEVDNADEKIKADEEAEPKSVTEHGLSEKDKEENTIINENEIKMNNPGNSVNIENNFHVDELDSSEESDIQESGSEKGSMHSRESEEVCQLPETSQRLATVHVKAYVTDPLVQLSSQTVVLPPTPCTSYSIAHIYLRSRPQKPCSIHEKITKFKTRFEFRTASKDLMIEPKHGYIAYKQSQKISLIYSPNLSKKEISDKALEMKVEDLKWKKIQGMLTEYYNAKEKKQPKGKAQNSSAGKKSLEDRKIDKKSVDNDKKSKKPKGKKSAGSVISVKTKKTKGSLKSSKLRKKSSGPLPEVIIDPADVKVTEEDMKNAEMMLLKYLEPYDETLTLLCLLETDTGDGNRRKETLRCEVLCSAVAPTIFLSTPACLDFGPVAVGTHARLEATVTNISFFDAFVRLSTLNPVGPIVCPAHLERPFWKNGELELPPEHILTIPIRFQPTELGEVVEAFEVASESTVLHLQARGRGVSPSFSFQPDREVFMMTSAAGKKADMSISISNTSEAPLRFRISQEYLKEGQALPVPKTEAPAADTSPKVKKGPKKEKKGKGFPEFTMLNEELENCLDNNFFHVENATITEPVFKLLNTDENIKVLPGETKQIMVRFTPPVVKQEMDSSKSPKSTKGSRKDSPENNKKAKKSADKEDTSTVDAKLDKKDGKKKKPAIGKGENTKRSVSEVKSLSVKSEKKDDIKVKQIFAARFSVIMADIYKVKDWVLLGTKK